jgi:hypothetical protein
MLREFETDFEGQSRETSARPKSPAARSSMSGRAVVGPGELAPADEARREAAPSPAGLVLVIELAPGMSVDDIDEVRLVEVVA